MFKLQKEGRTLLWCSALILRNQSISCLVLFASSAGSVFGNSSNIIGYNISAKEYKTSSGISNPVGVLINNQNSLNISISLLSASFTFLLSSVFFDGRIHGVFFHYSSAYVVMLIHLSRLSLLGFKFSFFHGIRKVPG